MLGLEDYAPDIKREVLEDALTIISEMEPMDINTSLTESNKIEIKNDYMVAKNDTTMLNIDIENMTKEEIVQYFREHLYVPIEGEVITIKAVKK